MKGRKPDSLPAADDALVQIPPPPTWLSKHAKAEWRRTAPTLAARQTLTAGDLALFEAFCAAAGAIREAQAALDRDGPYFAAENGLLKRHPALSAQIQATATLRQCAAELGLTPVARSRVAGKVADGDDDPSPLDL